MSFKFGTKTNSENTYKRSHKKLPLIKKSHVILVLDDSFSMDSYAKAAQEGINKTISDLAEKNKKLKTTVSIYSFGEKVERIIHQLGAEQVPLVDSFKPCQNWTSLYQAMFEASKEADTHLAKEDTAVIMIVYTDGYDNMSGQRFNDLQKWMKSSKLTNRCTVTAQVPTCRHDYSNSSRKKMLDIGLSPENIYEWDNNDKGAREATVVRTSGLTSHYANLSKGIGVTENFYATSAAANIRKKDLAEMEDVSNKFTHWIIEKESKIEDFVNSKGKSYIPGNAFYQLTKREPRVQPDKVILIKKKGEKALYQGDEARQLLGLKEGVNNVVNPGNHGNYDIFIQSKSINRALVRGTTLYYRK